MWHRPDNFISGHQTQFFEINKTKTAQFVFISLETSAILNLFFHKKSLIVRKSKVLWYIYIYLQTNYNIHILKNKSMKLVMKTSLRHTYAKHNCNIDPYAYAFYKNICLKVLLLPYLVFLSSQKKTFKKKIMTIIFVPLSQDFSLWSTKFFFRGSQFLV